MRRQRRHQNNIRFFYIAGIILFILLITLVVMYKIYNKNLKKISDSMLTTEQIIGLSSNDENNNTKKEEIERTSSIISKTIEEAKEEEEKEEIKVNETDLLEENEEVKTLENNNQEINPQEEKTKQKKELYFGYPVEGELVKDFSMDSLQYSVTLEEWTVHQGIDIKADRTTVVKAAEEGTVVAIKNDPRYGLTVIIEHQDGFKTVYSNLLTTEFVTEDEKVEKGQSLGTVGNSAVFEIADEPHLHFEILKDGEYVDPKIYLH